MGFRVMTCRFMLLKFCKIYLDQSVLLEQRVYDNCFQSEQFHKVRLFDNMRDVISLSRVQLLCYEG